MAEGYRDSYNRMEKKFVESLYDSRVFQIAKDNGKVLCPDCNVSQGKVQFFTISGIELHYRRIHKGKKFHLDTSVKLFQSFHFTETKAFIDQLSTFRTDNGTDQKMFMKCVVNSEDLEVDIIAKSNKEAVKLAGCILMHGGFVQPLSKNGYSISVKGEACDFPERFLVWRESTKIYTESVYTREVGKRFINFHFKHKQNVYKITL